MIICKSRRGRTVYGDGNEPFAVLSDFADFGAASVVASIAVSCIQDLETIFVHNIATT